MTSARLVRTGGADVLERMLAPCTPEEFLRSSWGVNFLHVRGVAGKFAQLMPWERLNEVLQHHRLDFPRFRLVKDGTTLPVGDYLRQLSAGRRRTVVPRLVPVELMNQLRQGATLVLDAVHELHKPIDQLATGLELFFGERVQVNLYAGWHSSRGFDLHWDDHDVFIVQVTGRKRWSVFGMTRPFPLASDVEPAEKPQGEPLWEGTLEDGDVLYIPRGWWHFAVPLDEPTLHLTVGVHNRTGIDLVKWLADRLRANESFRRDLSRFGSSSDREAHAVRLREEVLKEWDGSIVERFFSDLDAQAEPRPRFDLPWGAAARGRRVLSPRARVQMLAPRRVELRAVEGVVEVLAMKKRWRFSAVALPLLRLLDARRVCTIAELCEATRDTLDPTKVYAFVDELLVHGFVSVAEG